MKKWAALLFHHEDYFSVFYSVSRSEWIEDFVQSLAERFVLNIDIPEPSAPDRISLFCGLIPVIVKPGLSGQVLHNVLDAFLVRGVTNFFQQTLILWSLRSRLDRFPPVKSKPFFFQCIDILL